MGIVRIRLRYAAIDEVVAMIQAGGMDGRVAEEELLRRFEQKAVSIARALSARNGTLEKDMANAARLGLVQAAKAHTPGRDGFAAYAVRFMQGAATRMLRQLGKSWAFEDAVDVVPDTHGLDIYDHLRRGDWGDGPLAQSIATLSPRQRVLLIVRYVDDLSLKAISTTDSTSESAVSQRLATVHRIIERQLAA